MHPIGLAVVLSLSLAQATADSTAEWKQIDHDAQALSADVQQQDKAGVEKLAPDLKKRLQDFAAKYPKDPNAPKAKMFSLNLDILMRQLEMPSAPTLPRIATHYGEIVADASNPGEMRAEAAMRQTGLLLETAYTSKLPADWDAAEVQVDAFQKNFGDLSSEANHGQAIVVSLRKEELEAEKAGADPARYEALLTKLAKDTSPAVVAMVNDARTAQKQLADLQSKPLDIKFKAVDGTAVDLASMRGKVVLIDFWATWCGPCRGETPNVVAAYKKYHDKGFEIIGISLDQDKAALQKYVADNKMTWPQYFDGLGWQNSISSRFGIQSIPAMWVVGKDGLLVTQDGREDLDGQISKLLGAK